MSKTIQGEGDYEAARRFNKAEQDFVKNKYRKRNKGVTDPNVSEDIDDDVDLGADAPTEIRDRAGLDYLRRAGVEGPEEK